MLAEVLREEPHERRPSALVHRLEPLRDRGALRRARPRRRSIGTRTNGCVEGERPRLFPHRVRLRHGAREPLVDAAEQDLGEVHEVVVRRVRLVELEHRELGVVPRADALVPVAAPNLVDALEPADDQALQVELRRDAHEEAHVERVVVRLEGRAAAPPMSVCIVGVSTSRKPRSSRIARDRPHDVAPRAEHICDVGVGDEVDVALAVAELDVGEAVPLLGERAVAPW